MKSSANVFNNISAILSYKNEDVDGTYGYKDALEFFNVGTKLILGNEGYQKTVSVMMNDFMVENKDKINQTQKKELIDINSFEGSNIAIPNDKLNIQKELEDDSSELEIAFNSAFNNPGTSVSYKEDLLVITYIENSDVFLIVKNEEDNTVFFDVLVKSLDLLPIAKIIKMAINNIFNQNTNENSHQKRLRLLRNNVIEKFLEEKVDKENFNYKDELIIANSSVSKIKEGYVVKYGCCETEMKYNEDAVNEFVDVFNNENSTYEDVENGMTKVIKSTINPDLEQDTTNDDYNQYKLNFFERMLKEFKNSIINFSFFSFDAKILNVLSKSFKENKNVVDFDIEGLNTQQFNCIVKGIDDVFMEYLLDILKKELAEYLKYYINNVKKEYLGRYKRIIKTLI